jgi:hypothetical protein
MFVSTVSIEEEIVDGEPAYVYFYVRRDAPKRLPTSPAVSAETSVSTDFDSEAQYVNGDKEDASKVEVSSRNTNTNNYAIG